MRQFVGDAFCLEEAAIDDSHQAIRDGRTTCVTVVQHYIDRGRADNGVSLCWSPRMVSRCPKPRA